MMRDRGLPRLCRMEVAFFHDKEHCLFQYFVEYYDNDYDLLKVDFEYTLGRP